MNPRLRSLTLIFGAMLLLGSGSIVYGQRPALVTEDRPFEPAEELTYKAELSRSLLRKLDVASFKFTVARVANGANNGGHINESRAYLLRLTGDVESQGFFTKLFGINFHQQVESTVEPTSFAVLKTIRLDEQGKRIRSSEAVFNHELGQVTWVERDPKDPTRPERTVTAKFQEPIHDVLSAIYYLRMCELEPGKQFDVPISDSGKVYAVPMTVVERKRMKTPLGRVSVIRVDPQLFGPGRMLSEEGRFSIWITDDHRRIPVSARLKMQFGTFDITLKKVLHNSNAPVLAAER